MALAGAALRVFQVQAQSDALPPPPAVLLSFSVPEPLVKDARRCARRYARARCVCRCSSERRELLLQDSGRL